jgi:hypothetical protein
LLASWKRARPTHKTVERKLGSANLVDLANGFAMPPLKGHPNEDAGIGIAAALDREQGH